VLHSPTLTSTKAWAGALGLWANYACIFAKLIIDGKNYGMQAFITQIRDLDTHEALPGIKVGDLGPKLGMNSNDNGWMILDHVRVPRFNMLAGF
jgi:acyl-CoA oxidase